ncbi:MAG: PadR family transcriptional regulator, partial [Planctomycetota bacterium]
CLADGPKHGYAITRRLRERSGERFLVEEGTLYPALHRLDRLALVKAEWGTSENNRKARFYRITAAGRRRLAEGTSRWQEIAAAVTAVLDGSPAPGRPFTRWRIS